MRQGEVNPKDLCSTTDITEAVKAKRDETKAHIEQALEVVNLGEHPSFSPSLTGLGCFGEWLSIYKLLFDVEPGSIYNLCALNAGMVRELEASGISKLINIPGDFKLSAKQSLQVQATKQGLPIIHENKIREYLASFDYPLYFFDYETLASIVPYFDGLKPYQQVPFQYWLVFLDSPGADLRHVGYLHRKGSNPAERLERNS